LQKLLSLNYQEANIEWERWSVSDIRHYTHNNNNNRFTARDYPGELSEIGRRMTLFTTENETA